MRGCGREASWFAHTPFLGSLAFSVTAQTGLLVIMCQLPTIGPQDRAPNFLVMYSDLSKHGKQFSASP